ncbi:hypothetical protein BY458DRAFT_528265 [Sporodiniella umbellata]|nr:hypothetical protein BY458DRAFT_528265 [Sporodiniella umbellata]
MNNYTLYADQLLDQVFQNAKESNPAEALSMHPDWQPPTQPQIVSPPPRVHPTTPKEVSIRKTKYPWTTPFTQKKPVPKKKAMPKKKEIPQKNTVRSDPNQPSFWKPRETGLKVHSVKKPKRPMAFKTPQKKPGVTVNSVKSLSASPSPATLPPLLVLQPNAQGYYVLPSSLPEPVPKQPTPQRKKKITTTMQNPREASNDKCTVM